MPYINYKSHDTTRSLSRFSLDIFLRMLAAGFMCLIVLVSMNSIFLMFGTQATGYTLQQKQEDGTYVTVKKVSFDDGEAVYPNIDDSVMKLVINEEMTPAAKKACGISSQILMLALFSVLIYTEIWSCGSQEMNYAKYNNIKEDKIKGAKAAIIACIPYLVASLVIVLSNLGVFSFSLNSTFSFINTPFKPFIDWVLSGTFMWYDALLLLLPAAYIVGYAQLAYAIGYRQIFISEKILYTNK